MITSFKMPNDRSMLSMAHNQIENGDDFRCDGWIYDFKGNRKRKWFVSLYDNGEVGVIWEPKYKDIQLLEGKRWKAIQYYNKWMKKVFDPAFKAIAEVGQAHAFVTHAFNGSIPPWWLYTHSEYGISMEWVDEPKDPLNLDIGNRYYQVEYYEWKQIIQRKRIFVAAFDTAMRKYFYREQIMPKQPGETVEFLINGRSYWYISDVNRHSVSVWMPLSSPEKPTKRIVI